MTALRTPEAILSYPNLLKARAMENPDGTFGKEKFSATLIFLVDTPARFANVGQAISLTELKQAAAACGQEKWGEKFQPMLKQGKIRTPFRTDTEEKGYPDGAVFINVTSIAKPGVVSRFRGPDGLAQVLDDEQIADLCYPGAIVRASVRAFAYDVKGNKGISFGLNNLQWLGDGDRLDSRTKATQDFESLDDGDDIPEAEGPDAPEPEPAPAPKGRKAAPAELPAGKAKVKVEDLL